MKREVIKTDGGMHLDYIKSDRFHFSLLSLTLRLGRLTLREKKALLLLSSIMERSNGDCPTTAEYDSALERLYSPVISFGFSEETCGEVLFTLGVDFAGGNVFGEGLFSAVIDFLSTSLHRPLVGSPHFPRVLSETADFIRGNLLADLGDPEALSGARFSDISAAMQKSIECSLTFEEKLGIPDEITCADVEEIYKKLLASKAVYAFFMGREEKEEVLSAIKRLSLPEEEYTPARYERPALERHVEVSEPFGGMTRIHLGFSYSGKREAALMLASYLGSCPQSPLFSVLREEKRYCYSVDSYHMAPSMIAITTAVDPKLEERARDCILEIVEEAGRRIDTGIFKAAYANARLSLCEVFDSRSLIEGSCFSEYLGYRDDPFSLSEALASVGEEEVRLLAESLTLMIDYTQKGTPSPVSKKGYTKGEWIDI